MGKQSVVLNLSICNPFTVTGLNSKHSNEAGVIATWKVLEIFKHSFGGLIFESDSLHATNGSLC